MYVCMYVCMYVSTCVYIYACGCMRVHICIAPIFKTHEHVCLYLRHFLADSKITHVQTFTIQACTLEEKPTIQACALQVYY